MEKELTRLIGKHVRRNVYGRSIWKDVIVDVFYMLSATDKGFIGDFCVIPYVRLGKGKLYPLSELILTDI